MIQAASIDVLCVGSGAIQVEEGESFVPSGIRLIILAPLEASVAKSLAIKLDSGVSINALEIVIPETKQKTPVKPLIYEEGAKVPNYLLYPIDGSWFKPGIINFIGVAKATTLAELWPRITIFTIPNKTINCFWAPCRALKGAKNPIVIES